MLPIPTIAFSLTLPPLTWTGVFLGIIIGAAGILGFGLWLSARQDRKPQALSFNQVKELHKTLPSDLERNG